MHAFLFVFPNCVVYRPREMSLSPMSSFSPTSAPQGMLMNPSGCQKFVVNVFKAGSGRCRDCGHEWFQHEGVIDKAIAEKFRSIWANGERRPSPVATSGVPPLPLQSLNQTPIKTMKDLKEEKKRALLAKRNIRTNSGEDWFNGGGDSARSSRSNIRSVDENDSEDEFKFYSKEEFLARESSRSGGFDKVSGKPVKVVNLIDFENKEMTPPRVAERSPRLPPLGGEVVVNIDKLREMEDLMRSLQSQLNEKEVQLLQLQQQVREEEPIEPQVREEESRESVETFQAKICQLEKLLHEKDLVASTAKAESSRLLDELDRVMLESNRKVRELEELVEGRAEEQEKTKKILEDRDREIDTLKTRLVEKEKGQSAGFDELARKLMENEARIASMEKEVVEKQRRVDELELINTQEKDRTKDLESVVAVRDRQIEELQTAIQSADGVVCDEVQKLQTENLELESRISQMNRELADTVSRESLLQKEKEVYQKKSEELKEIAASQDSEILKLRREISEHEMNGKNMTKRIDELVGEKENVKKEAQNQVERLREQFAIESNKFGAESARLRSENEILSTRVSESAEQLRIERNNNIEVQGRLLRAEETITDLTEKLKQSSDELNNSMRFGNSMDQIREANEHYLDAIADVAIVLRTACDKYLTPHSSMANSRVHSVEDIGSGIEAIRVLESNVKSVLRMIDNVYEKCRYLEKENTKLETNVYDLQLINQGLKEKMNKSFMQRLFEPMLSCGLPGNSSPQSAGIGNSPIVRNYIADSNREMSHLLPPGQVSMLDDPDVHP